MKSSDIDKYTTSKDYKELYRLLKEGIVIIGFIAVEFNGVVSTVYSRLVEMSYTKPMGSFDFGCMVFFEADFGKDDFVKLCEKHLVRFVPINN